MSTTYAGDPSNYPTDITIPSDGDGPGVKVADVNVALEGLADRTAALQALHEAVTGPPTTYTTTVGVHEFVVPDNVTRLLLDGYGAGGGGAGGTIGAGGVGDQYSCGGGGGGAAIRRLEVVNVTPGDTIEIEIPAGGAGGPGQVNVGLSTATPGSSGGDTIVRIQGGAELARFVGATGGKASTFDYDAGSIVAPGGAPVGIGARRSQLVDPTMHFLSFCWGPGYGGDGTAQSDLSRPGANSLEGYSGGGGGTAGADDSTYRGGGAGGGGAAGPGYHGTAGANGGAAHSGSTGSNGANASNAADNSGSGGGGGGGGGSSGSGSGGNGGNGGNGGSGKLTLYIVG